MEKIRNKISVNKSADLIEQQQRDIERLREALESSVAWMHRWTKHVGNCATGGQCTCGRTAILFEAHTALSNLGKAEAALTGHRKEDQR